MAVCVGRCGVHVKIAVRHADIHIIDQMSARIVGEGENVIQGHRPIAVPGNLHSFLDQVEGIRLCGNAGDHGEHQDDEHKGGQQAEFFHFVLLTI